MNEGKWTYKTLMFGADGTAVWKTANFEFDKLYGACEAAAAYMMACARRGHMVVVSLEPAAEYKSAMVRLNEHAVMLDELKRLYTANEYAHLWNLIHKIDPDWLDPINAHSSPIAKGEDDGAD
jgi:hypothetical protein